MTQKLKKLISFIVICACLPYGKVHTSAADISVYIDNTITQFKDANGNIVDPFIQDGTTYVPIRGVSQILGCIVDWDKNNKTIYIYKETQPDGTIIRNSSDDIKIYIDGEETVLTDANGTIVNPFIIDGTTYIPLRGISQAFGNYVRWDGHNRSVKIYENLIPEDGVTLSENKPYETSGCMETYYELDADFVQLDNISYTNALGNGVSNIYFQTDNKGEAYFSLDGKFDKISFIAGSTRQYEEEKKITFIVDGKTVDSIEVAPNSSAKEYSVELDKGLQLKIIIAGQGTAMGNIIFN